MKRFVLSLLLLAGLLFGALQVLAAPTIWTFSLINVQRQTIISALLNGGTTGSFTAPAATGTTIGTLSATCSNACSGVVFALSQASPCDATSGADNGSFSLSGTTTLNVNAGTPAGSYHACVVASGAPGSAYGNSVAGQFTITGAPVVQQTITSVLLNGGSTGSFGAPAGTNTTAGSLSETCSNTCTGISVALSQAAPCDATSGANNSSFSLAGTTVNVNSGLGVGTYKACVVASGLGYSNTLAGKFTITGATAVISSVQLNGGSTGQFPAPSVTLWGGVGTTQAGTLLANCSGSPCNGITYAFSTTAPPCTPANGADNASFAIGTIPPVPPGTVFSDGSVMTQTGWSLNPNVGVGTGTYHVCVAASGGYSNSPVGGPFVITGLTPQYPSTDGAVAVAPNGSINTLFQNVISPATSGLSQVSVPQQWKLLGGTPDSCGNTRAFNGKVLSGTSAAFVFLNNIVYAYTSCGTNFGGPWFQYNRSTGGFTAIGAAAPTEAGIPPQPILATVSAPTCTSPITVPCETAAGVFHIPDNTTSGTVLATVTVATSDGSAFAGTLSDAPATPLGVSSYNIVAARNFTSADDNTTFSTVVKAVPVTQPSVAAMSVAPLTFMTQTGNAGSEVALLSTTKGQSWGVEQPSFSLCTTCGDDSGLFVISGNDLLVGAADLTVARTYNITVSDNEDGSNSPFTRSFALNGVPNTGTINCPSLAPPAALRAGQTTLAYCGDFSQPKYATYSNWAECYGGPTNPFEWEMATGTTCADKFFQDTDPLTSKTVLHIHGIGSANGDGRRYTMNTVDGPPGAASPPNNGKGFDFPAANYIEFRGRHTIVTPGTSNEPSPDWFLWDSCATNSPNAKYCVGGTAGWWLGWNGPIENDIFEYYGLAVNSGNAGAIHTVWSPVCGNAGNGVCKYWTPDLLLGPLNVPTGYPQTIPSWTSYGSPGFTYGALTTWSGDQTNPGMQLCDYLNDRLLLNNTGENCYYRDYIRNNGYLYADQQQMANRRAIAYWLNGNVTNQEAYIEFFRVWSCPAWKTDPTCVGNGIAK